MQHEITKLVDQYETGKLSRRQLVAGLGSLAAVMGGAGHVLGQDPVEQEKPARKKSTFEAVGLNHIALRVTDLERSRDFYREHLGLRVTSMSRTSCFLQCGPHFLALFKARNAEMDHYCYSIEKYEVDDVERRLKAVGIEPRVVRRDKRIYFKDPDGLTVQLAAKPRRDR